MVDSQPLWNICASQIGSLTSPIFGVENEKYLSCHHLRYPKILSFSCMYCIRPRDAGWRNSLWAGHHQQVMMNDQSMATRTPVRKPVDMITIPSEGFMIHSQVVQDFFHQQYITKPNNALFFSRNPSKLPYICIVWSPPKTGGSMTPTSNPPKKTLQYPTQDSQVFQLKRVSMLGFVSILTVSSVRIPHDGMYVKNIWMLLLQKPKPIQVEQKFKRVTSFLFLVTSLLSFVRDGQVMCPIAPCCWKLLARIYNHQT